ncbi:MAG: 2,3-bisphosphoglycerate-independent phosphoglycerate mutase [Candidatus Marinimicrobia bacterium]|jgi:2,3-bisphosphoglycerate-independent phosphoglycerate mutase|nr:2,3-bisphosphoglycerate-independent phosphoglycerate mutase [Candidatus Neomarinimicrobiota bacterium]MBT3680992.1 2,3-bisphosphoglycerate-independent phosphoglycerate mutase [Candidatus Neomarinimicrobiota bacterium]MBT3952125.1 2,3-bisphosphoglycerate-independent phosphoglycerate mutase [Candidatus Neomarinimicrobiota bacterium]MBT4254323.1 2,3-bisphosphoglycerate-independent phosphoglycerate mutase [Candidatus Neomarinimicrobiota bacterium]MBT4479504.1 2,3-bisphosphoglycerate-independent 
MKPVVLIVLDGVGYTERTEGNAVLAANTPNLDSYRNKYPRSLLGASGEAVGLPAGFQGSSEVGHLSMGAGKVVIQELKRINDQLESGKIYNSDLWKTMMQQWHEKKSTFHLMGLLQDEGVHAHYDHLFKFIRQASIENPGGKIVIHPFLDGRDTPPRSALEHLGKLEQVMSETDNVTIGTLMGRYYGMDRGKVWEITDRGYDCIVSGKGRAMTSATESIQTSWEKDKTPSGEDMFDEYIEPFVMDGYTGIHDGDVVLHTNYRQDRATQLTLAFTSNDYPGAPRPSLDIIYAGMTAYYDGFDNFLLTEAGGDVTEPPVTVGQLIAEAGLHQLRMAETQKFPHVTSFFNGKLTTPFKNEDREELRGRFDPASFADHPEMEAHRVTEKFLEKLAEDKYDFIMVNYANGDMVGHTGNFTAGVKAVEVLDKCLAQIIPAILAHDGQILMTADHGNVDQMIDYETGAVRTSHSLNPVELLYIAQEPHLNIDLSDGCLSDIGITILNLLGINPAPGMDAKVLITKK